MRQTMNDNIFKTYRPKGLPCSRFTDERYEQVLDSFTRCPELAPVPSSAVVKTKSRVRCQYTQEFIESKRYEVLHLAEDYFHALGVNDFFQDEILKTFDFMFPLFPRRHHIHESAYLAEIIVFHKLKERSILFDPENFRNASPIGNMPMYCRPWLLQYKQYLPAPRTYPLNKSPEKFLVLLYESHDIREEFKKKCEEIKPIVSRLAENVHSKIIAGMICLLASKTTQLSSTNMNNVFKILGIKHAGTIHNAVKRLKNRWKSVWTLFFRKEIGIDRE